MALQIVTETGNTVIRDAESRKKRRSEAMKAFRLKQSLEPRDPDGVHPDSAWRQHRERAASLRTRRAPRTKCSTNGHCEDARDLSREYLGSSLQRAKQNSQNTVALLNKPSMLGVETPDPFQSPAQLEQMFRLIQGC